MPKLPRSKGLDQRVSEPHTWSCVLVLVKVEGGAGETGGLPKQNYYFSNSKNHTSTIAHYKWENGQRQITPSNSVSLSSHCVACMNAS